MHEAADIAIVILAAGFVAVLVLAALAGWKLTRTVRRWRRRVEHAITAAGFGPAGRPIEARVVTSRAGRPRGPGGPLAKR